MAKKKESPLAHAFEWVATHGIGPVDQYHELDPKIAKELKSLKAAMAEFSNKSRSCSLDFSNDNPTIVIADASTTVRIPFVFTRSDRGEIRVKIESERLEDHRYYKQSERGLPSSSTSFAQFLAEEWTIRARDILQVRAAAAYTNK